MRLRHHLYRTTKTFTPIKHRIIFLSLATDELFVRNLVSYAQATSTVMWGWGIICTERPQKFIPIKYRITFLSPAMDASFVSSLVFYAQATSMVVSFVLMTKEVYPNKIQNHLFASSDRRIICIEQPMMFIPFHTPQIILRWPYDWTIKIQDWSLPLNCPESWGAPWLDN